ncbi:MAG TPA: RimK/LysX family protein [Verrucomicrobiae bacterium]|jgi:hypothetical protein|nr:RimK/LysX family protein [Verrucomicrobiae bacterium]
MDPKQTTIGRAEYVNLPEYTKTPIPARVDTGAKTSAIWASNIIEKDGVLMYSLFGQGSQLYTGNTVRTKTYSQRLVANSTGHVQQRYAVRKVVSLKGRKIRATFTLADRSEQVYPILLGRNVLRGKFIVDVKLGTPLLKQERLREVQKQAAIDALHADKDSV